MENNKETIEEFDPVAYVRTIRAEIPPDSPRRIDLAWRRLVRECERDGYGELRAADCEFIIKRLAADIERRDGAAICEKVHIRNRFSRVIFEALTDQPLPEIQRGTNERVYAWLKKEAEKNG